MAPLVLVQGQVKVAKKAKTPHLQRSPQRTSNRKRKAFFFRFRAEDLLHPWMVWIALKLNRLASCGQKNAKQIHGLSRSLKSKKQRKKIKTIFIFLKKFYRLQEFTFQKKIKHIFHEENKRIKNANETLNGSQTIFCRYSNIISQVLFQTIGFDVTITIIIV